MAMDRRRTQEDKKGNMNSNNYRNCQQGHWIASKQAVPYEQSRDEASVYIHSYACSEKQFHSLR